MELREPILRTMPAGKELPSGFLKMLGRILTCPSWKTHCIGGVAREQWERRSTERSRDGLNGDLKKELLPDQWKLVAMGLGLRSGAGVSAIEKARAGGHPTRGRAPCQGAD